MSTKGSKDVKNDPNASFSFRKGQIVNINVEKTEAEACFNDFVHVAFVALLGEGDSAVEKISIEVKREDWVVFIKLLKTVIFFFCLWIYSSILLRFQNP